MKGIPLALIPMLLLLVIATDCLHHLPILPMAPTETLEIHLTYGSYTNDHYHRKFYASEHEWVLEQGLLRLTTTGNSTIRKESVQLPQTDLDTIADHVKMHCMKGDVVKDLHAAYLDKMGLSKSIIGNIRYGARRVNIHLKTNGSSDFEADAEAQPLLQLETLLYAAITRQRD